VWMRGGWCRRRRRREACPAGTEAARAAVAAPVPRTWQRRRRGHSSPVSVHSWAVERAGCGR
jgi:hypothetical protein